MTRTQANEKYLRMLKRSAKEGCSAEATAPFGRHDLFFLLVYILHRKDADNDWVFNRCREFQRDPYGHVDLWCREHYKSTIITFAWVIQQILLNPEITIGLFSATRPIAKAFLRQIKIEFQQNDTLQVLYPEVLWRDPQHDAPKWSEDDGIIVRRKSNPKESTVEAWGLIDAMPTSKHYAIILYDDVVVPENVRSVLLMKKTIDAMQMSFNLGTQDGHRVMLGTCYDYNDANQVLIKQGSVKARIYGPTVNNKEDGELHLWDRKTLQDKMRDLGPYISACQLFQDPRRESRNSFDPAWLRYWKADRFNGLSLYLLVDPANEKKKTNDYSVFIVVGLGADHNYYIVTWVRDRLGLSERANTLFTLHQRYDIRLPVGYERYGMQADVQYMKERMERSNYRFSILELGGTMPKVDRINQLVPLFKEGRIYLPENCVHRQYDGQQIDVTQAFVTDEYSPWPYPVHDDMLDCLARIRDPDLSAVFPRGEKKDPLVLAKPAEYDPIRFAFGDK